MGLDMYLYAERWCADTWHEDDFKRVKKAGLAFPGNPDSFKVSAKVAYWRKANAIHGWFVREIGGGKDDCQRMTVSVEQLEALRLLCVDLLKRRDPAEAIKKLPPCEGFFFGTTDIDEWFWQYLEATVQQLNVILVWDKTHAAALGKEYSGVDYVYQASW